MKTKILLVSVMLYVSILNSFGQAVKLPLHYETDVFNKKPASSSIIGTVTPRNHSEKSTTGNNLLAYFPFNGDAKDESGSGHDGSINGNATMTPDRFMNESKAFTFPDQSSNISLANSTNTNLANGFTFNAWVKYKNNNITAVIVCKHVCGFPNGFFFGIDTDGQIQLWLANSGWSTVRTNTTFVENRWYMMTASYDSGTGIAKVYINGEIGGSGNVTYNNFSSNPISIGESYNNNCGAGNLSGAIDEVKIYDRPLSDAEISEEYTLSRNSLVAHYPFNGNANDESGNLLHGSVDGATLTTDRSGNVNSAYLFDGNDIITIAYNDKLNADKELSISVWVKPDVLQDALILGKSNWWTQTNYLIRTKSTGFIQFEYRDMAYNTNNPLIVGQWNHIAVVSDAANSKKVYINGVLATHTGGVSPFNMVPEVLTIGGASYGSEYFKGAIDDLKIYKTTLSESDILYLYNYITLEIDKTHELTLSPYFVFSNSLHFKNQQNLNEIKTIEVYNLLGQKVFDTSKITEPINLGALQRGVYILKVLNKNGKRNVLKFSIE